MNPGLIFDMDDTLYPERQFIRSGFRAVAADVHRRFNVPSRAVVATLLQALRFGGRSQALQAMCLRYDLPPTVVPDLVEVIRSHTPTLHVPMSAIDTLTRARADGWRLGVLTNGLPDIQARKARALGLDALVDTIVYAQEWGSGRGKPEREPFEVVRCRLETPTALTVFVGDDPWCDMFGARAAGLRTILVRRGGPEVRASGADRVVSAIDDVLKAAAGLICREVADAA